MQYYKTDISKVLEGYKEGKTTLEQAIQLACVAYDKEVSAPDADIIARREEFRTRMLPYVDKFTRDMLNKFFTHWTSFKTPKSKLMLFEQQKTFNMGMRLATWQSNSERFKRQTAMIKVVGRNKYGR